MRDRTNAILRRARLVYSALNARRRRGERIGHGVAFGERLTIGNGSWLWAPRRLSIGNDVSVGSGVRIEVDGTIGDHVLIANGAAIVGRRDHDMSEIGTSIRYARRVHEHPEDLSLATHIGSDVWVGYGAIILSGVMVGDSSIVGAGAIVISDVPPNSIVVGSPARVVGQRYSAQDFVEHWRQLSANGVRPSRALRGEE
ncbi:MULTISPECIES: acyltransferase [unclassified Microbacterium]|uniref:acyltransferase n=1 Tax=unclassified Microbacterium TaxID=2609290 RepID=UPI00254BAF8C|nr:MULTISPECIES: acyltransferase [unclassified Microbacterium]WIM18677.1 acyltransferase [Microbacterium sp. zg-B185]